MTTPEIIAQARDGRRHRLAPATPTPPTSEIARRASSRPARASRTCSTRCRSSPAASPAPWAPRWTIADSWCGIIVDGHHVDPAVLRIALRCKRRDRFMLVTDAMPSVGAADKLVHAAGPARSPSRTACCVDEDGTLAGSRHRHGERRAQRRRDARRRPARGRAHGEPLSGGLPRPRQRARAASRRAIAPIWCSWTNRLNVVETWIDGRTLS